MLAFVIPLSAGLAVIAGRLIARSREVVQAAETIA